MAVADVNYNSTLALTDVVDVQNNDIANTINPIGMSQEAVYTLLNSIVTNVNALNAKLDADGGVTDEDYASTYNLTALASQGQGLSKTGMNQGDLYTQLLQLETNWNGILTKLDADDGVANNNYNSLHAVDLNNRASTNGLGQDDIVSFLNSFLTQFNAALTKLDADA